MGIFKTIYHLNSNTKQCSVEKGHKQKLGSRKNSMMYVPYYCVNYWKFLYSKSEMELVHHMVSIGFENCSKTLLANFSKNFQKIVYFQNE